MKEEKADDMHQLDTAEGDNKSFVSCPRKYRHKVLLSSVLIWIIYASYIWADPIATDNSVIHSEKYYIELIDKFPLSEAINALKQLANSGDCNAAGYLAFLLKSKNIKQLDDYNYWLIYAAKCGHIPSIIELGYPNKYSTNTIIPCGDSKLEIITECNPLDNKIRYPVCDKQKFLFFDNKNNLLNKQVANNKPLQRENRVLAWSAVCTENLDGYYVITSTNFGGSCCEWEDVFDKTGIYIGSTDKRSSFEVVPRFLSDQQKDKIFRNFKSWTVIEVNSYPRY